MSEPLIISTEPAPLRTRKPPRPPSKNCPKCGAGPDKRVASGGFGVQHPVCSGGCEPAHEWHDEVFRG